jgi:hypothetical protein
VSQVSGEGALGTSDGDNTSLHVNSDYINETKAQQMKQQYIYQNSTKAQLTSGRDIDVSGGKDSSHFLFCF